VKKAAHEGKCWDTVDKEMKLAKYASTPGYRQALPFILRRYYEASKHKAVLDRTKQLRVEDL
jgi:hypothetical protein